MDFLLALKRFIKFLIKKNIRWERKYFFSTGNIIVNNSLIIKLPIL